MGNSCVDSETHPPHPRGRPGVAIFVKGDVVVIPFLFSDLTPM